MADTAITGQLYIISAPSGAGKSSLIQHVLADRTMGKMKVSVSHTTRNLRPGEQNGIHYHFIDKNHFESMIADDEFIEFALVFEHYYGTSYMAIEHDLQKGFDVFLDIDWQGARQVRNKVPTARSIFILPPTKAVLRERLLQRGQDSAEIINHRMAKAVSEMSHYDEYDYVIVNDDFEQSVNEIKAIVQAERLCVSRQMISQQQLIANLLAE